MTLIAVCYMAAILLFALVVHLGRTRRERLP